MSCYDVIYKLRPVRECEPGWWKLRWRPIWRGTFSAYWSAHYPKSLKTRCGLCGVAMFGLGFRGRRQDAENGWGRYYKRLDLEIFLLWWTMNLWVRWDFRVMREGPLDMNPRRALDIPK
jgi:hypothetical protein